MNLVAGFDSRDCVEHGCLASRSSSTVLIVLVHLLLNVSRGEGEFFNPTRRQIRRCPLRVSERHNSLFYTSLQAFRKPFFYCFFQEWCIGLKCVLDSWVIDLDDGLGGLLECP